LAANIWEDQKMATTHKQYQSTHPGPIGSIKMADYHVPPEDGLGSFLGSNAIAKLFRKNCFPTLGGGIPYSAAEWTITTGGTGDAQAVAATAGGGLLITYASDDNFDTTLDSIAPFTPATGKVFALAARIRVSDADGLGIKIGMTTGGAVAALPFGTNYTDVVAFSKPIASAALVGTVRGNSGTAADSATLATMVDATEITVAFWVKFHATEPAGAWYVDGTITPFTAAQLAQVVAILTTPPTMYATIHGTGVTATTPTLTVTSFAAEVDN
jgi:hypothetical protein